MPDLAERQKLELVGLLACFREPTAIIAHFRTEHGIELSHKQVGGYDPTRSYYDAGERWREIFDVRRKAYLDDVSNIPVAHQGYRLNALQIGTEAAMKAKNWALMARLLEQAARDVGGVLTNRSNVRLDDNRRQRAVDMSPEDRRLALAQVIADAMASRASNCAERDSGPVQ